MATMTSKQFCERMYGMYHLLGGVISDVLTVQTIGFLADIERRIQF